MIEPSLGVKIESNLLIHRTALHVLQFILRLPNAIAGSVKADP